jgi:Pyruvate/2-oxoacid:ferredoxin oxidoreductase delta subunit
MATKVLRKIVRIDEEKCNGCGVCVPACADRALQIIDGKARLVNEKYCDGLGACLGECPQGAIAIVERAADDFDEEAVKHHLHEKEHLNEKVPCGCPSARVAQFERVEENLPCGCSSATVTQFERTGTEEAARGKPQPSMLRHWPVQLALVPPGASFLQGADLLLAADCVPFAYAGFHQDLLNGHALLVACPKLDDFGAHLGKLTEILRRSDVKSITVAHMEVPCCSGLVHMVKQAIRLSGKAIPLKEITIGMKGDRKT